ELLHVLAAAHVAAGAVHRDAERADRGLGEQGLGGDVAPRQVEVVEGDGRATLRELHAGGAPQTRGAARDDRHAPLHGLREPPRRLCGPDDRRATPAERCNSGRDLVPTNRWVLYGHHFAAIAGAGPLVGPVRAAQFGFLSGTIWLVIGVVLGGAVQDFTILFCSLRRDGKSLGQMAKEEVNPAAGAMAMLAVLFI